MEMTWKYAGSGDRSVVLCPPLNWKVGCSIHGHWVNRRSAPWATSFNSSAAARREFRLRSAADCRHQNQMKICCYAYLTRNMIYKTKLFSTRNMRSHNTCNDMYLTIRLFSHAVKKNTDFLNCFHQRKALQHKATNSLVYFLTSCLGMGSNGNNNNC